MSNFHSRIMNIPPNKKHSVDTYSCGHKDARHAAAEIASDADVKLEAWQKIIDEIIIGWESRDYPVGFCRNTAQYISNEVRIALLENWELVLLRAREKNNEPLEA